MQPWVASSLALAGTAVLAAEVAAVALLCKLAVRANTRLGMHALDESDITSRHGRIGLSIDEQPFPAKHNT